MARNEWVKNSINKIKECLDQYENLSNKRVQLLFEKSIFENTERCEEIDRKIAEISGQLQKLASKVKTGGELLIELELENNGFIKKVFNVNGMTCQSCAECIEHGVGKIDGVKWIKISLDKKEAYVEFDSGQATAEAVIDKITSLGFEAAVK